MQLTINKIQHIGIPVSDLERSEQFYTRLGFRNVMTSTFEINKQGGRVTMMQHGDIIIELYQMPDSLLPEIKLRKNGHIDHVAFDVPDIDATYQILKEAAFTIDEPAPVYLAFWEKGCKYFNVIGPDGERLEFNQIL